MPKQTFESVVNHVVYEVLGQKFRNFTFHVNFFTHGERIELKSASEGIYTFLLRVDKGAKNFKKEYEEKFKEIRVPVEFEDKKYEFAVALECAKEESH